MKRRLKHTFRRMIINLRRPSIRLYLILMNVILLCLLFPSISILFLNEEEMFRDAQLSRAITQMRESLENRGASLARSMALSSNQAIAGYDFTFLNIMANQVVSYDPEINYCIIMDTDRRVITHSDPANIGNILDSGVDHKIAALMQTQFAAKAPTYEQSRQIRFIENDKPDTYGNNSILEAVVPLYSGEQLWGVLRLGYSLKSLQEEINHARSEWAAKMNQFKIYLATMTAIFFSIGVLVAAFFTRSFVRSVRVLNDGVERISEGNLEHEIHQNGLVCSEVLDLTKAFNEMTTKLRSSHQQLDNYSRSLEQKVDERTKELQEAQANLMRQAHEAGMAEMAVGILHNIGNAITPAKVGASLLYQRINNSSILQNLPQMMSKFKDALANSPVETAEKERLLELAKLLPASINEEYNDFANEISHIRDKHEHIEGIINLQMRYARLYGDYEEVDINRVTDDALKMLDDTLRKRSVKVRRQINKVPNVKIERTKLIQIIVNLVKNAFESMDNVAVDHRQITITTEFETGPPPFVVFSIKDNGVGFTPEIRKKMFKFGFTSKDRGSGFGLHSCANYLIANNGSITAHSDGLGKGAEFIVRLAVEPQGKQPKTSVQNGPISLPGQPHS